MHPATSSEALSSAGRHRTVNGIRLWVEEAGAGPALLLVPGLGAGAWLWAGMRETLGRHFRLLMPELRGSGRSDQPDERYTVAGFADDLAALLDALGVDRAHVLGASLGGFVAQYLAAHWPERVDQLVLAATAVGGQNQIGPAGDVLARTIRPRGRSRRERLEDTYALGFTDAFRTTHPDRLDQITAWRMEHPQPEVAYYRQLLAGNAYDGAQTAPQIAAPTLICAGTDDAVVPLANAEALQALIPHARVEVFPGRHLFFFEEGAAFARTVIDFLTASPA